MKEVIWLIPKSPVPAIDGSRIATATLLRESARQGLQIHLVVFDSGDHATLSETLRSKLGLASVLCINPSTVMPRLIHNERLQSVLLSLLHPFLGLTLQRFANRRAAEQIQQLLQKKQSTILVIDSLHGAAAFASRTGIFKKPAGVKVFYRAHNREFRIWERKAATVQNPLLRLLFRQQAALVRRFENSLVTVATTMTVSNEDLNDFRKDLPQSRYVFVPIGTDFSEPIQQISGGSSLFFVGRIDWPPNTEGLRWFLETVWPVVHAKRPDLTLDIVGSGNGDWLAKYIELPGVRCHGRVEDLKQFYHAARLCLVPVFFGSGVRVKVIEAARFGRCCLSTAIGVEGLPLRPGQDYLHAESAAEWIDAILSSTTEQLTELGASSHRQLSSEYAGDEVAARFVKQLTNTAVVCTDTEELVGVG